MAGYREYKQFYELKTMEELVKLKQVTEERIKTINEVIGIKEEEKRKNEQYT